MKNTSLLGILLGGVVIAGANAGTMVVAGFGQEGWYSDDTRSSTGADLVGSQYTHYGKPGQTPSAADDTAIASQILFTGAAPGGRAALGLAKTSVGGGYSKSTISTVNLAGFATSSATTSWADGFAMAYDFYATSPNEVAVPKICVQSPLWASSQSGFTALRSGESTWDLLLVDWRGSESGWPVNTWTTWSADVNTKCWRVYRQAGNSYFNDCGTPASKGFSGTMFSLAELASLNDPNQPAHVARTDGATKYTWAQVLFGEGAKVTNVQIGVGSSTQSSTTYVDYLQLSVLNPKTEVGTDF